MPGEGQRSPRHRPRPRSSRRLPELQASSQTPCGEAGGEGSDGNAGLEEERAVALGLGALARRELTAAELEARLAARGFEPRVVKAARERLEAAGGVDDERYACLFAEDKRSLEGWGEERVRAALAQRGVAAHLVDRALAEVTDEGEIERAGELLTRRGEPVAGDASRGRAYGFLVRRGYPSEVAHAAIRRAESAGAERAQWREDGAG